MLDQIEQFHRQASAAYLRGEFEAATRCWEQVLQLDPADERAEEGIRLCQQLVGGIDPELASRAGQPALTAGDGAPQLDLELRLDDPLPPAAAADDSAACELTRRVEALLVTAREQVEVGQRATALRTLSRILILDEENEIAKRMQAELRSDQGEQHVTPPPVVASSADLHRAAVLDLEDLEREDEKPILTNVWEPPDAEPTENAQPAAADAASEPVALKKVRAKRSLSLPAWMNDRRVQLGLGGLLVLALLFGGVQFIGGGGAAPPDEALPSQSAEKRPRKKPAEVKPQAEAQQAEAVQAESEPVSLADPRKLMEQGEEAYARGDYAAAVIAFGNVLKQVPEDAGVRARLDAAGKRYREQETIRLRWEEAVAAFESHNYAEALRLFYRMDQADYESDLKRAKTNGWYNHGINALQMNRCDEAWDHFSEARSLDPLDEKILDGLEIAQACESTAMQVAMRSLTFRALDD